MPNIRQPRSGSLQYWPRKRSKRGYPRIRTFPESNEKGLTGFAGYKVGMTHVLGIETNKKSHKKGEKISVPVTIIECPPLRLASVRLYKKDNGEYNVEKEVLLTNDKNLGKKIKLPKKNKAELKDISAEEYDDIRVVVFTQPHLVKGGKKKPEIFEMGLGGSNDEKLEYINENIDKDILLETIFKEGDLMDLKAITKGKGFQGPVKRFGISIRQAKSEKSIRNPGSLGPWEGQGHIMWRVPHAGKMGYHQRTEYNKQILKIVEDPEEVTPKSGFKGYGIPKHRCILVKGSVAGPRKRLVVMQKPIREKEKKPSLPTINNINKD